VLEDRTVPSTLSVADVTVREGPTSLGILDPSGAASVGLNGTRGITFDTRPTDVHYGDLFVAGYISLSVARFDWASQTYQPFVASGSGGLSQADKIAVGPDGNVYVGDNSQNLIFRYDGSTGAPLPAPGQTGAVFVNANSTASSNSDSFAFGPDGNVYLSDYSTNRILEYQGPAGPSPGEYIGVFITINNDVPVVSVNNLAFGPDGNLYVFARPSGSAPGQIYRYDGTTGAPLPAPGQTGAVFVPHGSGGLVNARTIIFDPDGTNMYVTAPETGSGFISPGPGETTGQVLRYQGPNGPNPGAYVEAYFTAGQAGLHIVIGIARDTTGNLYVSDRDSANVTRVAPSSQAAFSVTLDTASASQVTVGYGTANGTAVGGTDYTATSGTLTFAPGVMSQTVNVPITTVGTSGSTKNFTMTLSNPVNATISRGTATGSILNRQTKFFVADGSATRTYEYGSGGTSEEITVGDSGNSASRGTAASSDGKTIWVVDNNKTVYVYSNHGVLLGSWSAGGSSSNATLTGVATNGTDLWLVDSNADKVYKYTGAASRLSGSQNAASNFKLAKGDSNPQDIVTDGTSFWVVDDGSSSDKVYKYNLSGSSLGSWTLDAANKNPTGITINPNNVSDIWIVDNGTLKVYQYVGAATRTSGSQNAAATFALNSNDTNPQGIADPPVPGTISVPAPTAPATISPPILAPAFALQPSLLAPVSTGRDAVFALVGNAPSIGLVNQTTQRPTERNVAAILPLNTEAAPILAARSDAVFAGSQEDTEIDVLPDVPLFSNQEASERMI
jgi:sugar lactone lactonase YvrE